MEVKIKKEEVKKPVDKKNQKNKKKDKKDEKITDRNNDKFVVVFMYLKNTIFIHNCFVLVLNLSLW